MLRSPTLATLAPRAGFGLLLATLLGVAVTSWRDAQAGRAAVAAERARLEAVSSAALRAELLAALDVAEARLEALETLPLLDETGLVLVRDGVQLAPRLAAQAPPTQPAPAARAPLDALLARAAPGLDEAQRALVHDAAARGDAPSWPAPLAEPVLASAREALERASLPPLLRLAWTSALVADATRAAEPPAWALALAGPGLPRAPGRGAVDGLQAAVLRAWPWLSRDAAARWCLDARRTGEALDLAVEDFVAACQRGLAGERVDAKGGAAPWLRGEVLAVERPRADDARTAEAAAPTERLDLDQPTDSGTTGEPRGARRAEAGEVPGRERPRTELRGVRVDLAARLAAVTASRREAGVLAADDRLALPAHDGPLAALHLRLESPRLDAAARGHDEALRWKLGFAALTALLGTAVMLLAGVAQRRREETLAAQRDFVATVSHELRTPLASLRLLAETLERRLEGHDPARDYPRRLVQAADGLTFLVDNILSFNRLEAGRWAPAKEPFVFTALEPLLREESALAPDVTLEVTTRGLAGMAPHTLDARLLDILVRNLARNAWKYGQRQPVRFAVDGHDEGDVAVLRFADNGPGIPAEAWERVFEAFHRLPAGDGRAVGGSGLGLALARRIAALHGGTLRIAASSSEGTTFELRLPRR